MVEQATVIMIPARLRSQRLPNKPLAEIGGVPMIVQVWRRACEAEVGPVIVACAEPEIAAAVEAHGGRAALTDPELPSGTDRIFQALREVDRARGFERVINLQGDLPTLEPAAIRVTIADTIWQASTALDTPLGRHNRAATGRHTGRSRNGSRTTIPTTTKHVPHDT